ncbi:phenylalanine--tRNA ligase subunit alpha [Flammeovirgaceae bacterium SG7u.111]|nr:phenylalanine--tRNA ligase subunit alpha [Flammeovirgaceae bacterium SG7u.132]WPO35429.1 phenylalanine--tRNA ligase subunit alpha [Flammeovirgaceae bacterium SG7u.111]
MIDKLEELIKEVEKSKLETEEVIEKFRLKFISRKGVMGDFFANIKDVAPEKRKEFGQKVNELKNLAQQKFKDAAAEAKKKSGGQQAAAVDLTLPTIPNELGTIHPITQVRNRIVEIFQKIGFNLSEGPEIENDWHNFSALNFPPNHPAREMQDTFFIEKDPEEIALRTHTSSVQVRVMENQEPPIRTLSPGRVYRNETISARAHCIFHQVEGLYVNENVSFQDLKNTLYYFAKEMFGKDTKIRLRPSYFPFTEPSAELDIYWGLKTESDKKITKGTGWLEIGGCGMVDPNVLANCNIDPEKYTGFAFGMGIERIAMLKYKINDIRLFTENDTRFLRQFSGLS